MVARELDAIRLAAARLRAADIYPFLALALYALSPSPAPGLGTFAVDERWRLYADPDALARWSVQEAAGVLLHEVSHLVRDHAGRARSIGVNDTTAPLWNVAADAEINDDLLDDGVVLPDQPVTPQRLGLEPHRTAEHYFNLLPELPEGFEVVDCGPGSHGHGDTELVTDLVTDLVRVAPGDTAISPALPDGLGEAEVELLRRRIASALVAQLEGRPGSVAGGWERWAEAVLRPSLGWRQLLTSRVRSAAASITGRVDFTYQRVSRRRLPRVVLPAMHHPLPRVAVVVDTSASMSDEMLGAAWSEVHGCLEAIGLRRDLLAVYATDTVAHRVTLAHRRQVALTGGGGTSMSNGLMTALRTRPPPDLVIVLTDGWTDWPDAPPRRPVVVGLLDPAGRAPDPPSWARVVRIDLDDEHQ